MNNSTDELVEVKKLNALKTKEPKSLKELFSPEDGSEISDEAKKYLEAQCQREVKKFLDQQNREHEMVMKERQANLHTSRAITGLLVTWGVVGLAMLGRSCINFDKGPKFKV